MERTWPHTPHTSSNILPLIYNRPDPINQRVRTLSNGPIPQTSVIRHAFRTMYEV